MPHNVQQEFTIKVGAGEVNDIFETKDMVDHNKRRVAL